MFPDITREDIFRLETRRLWLRWPMLADGDAATLDRASAPRPQGPVPEAMPEAATGDPYGGPASGDLFRADALPGLRREAAAGTALHLVLTGRGTDRRPFGRVSLTPIHGRIEDCGLLLQTGLAETHRGSGFATEAVQAVLDAAFMLTDTPLVAASARVLDPAFRRVLEKCGFAYCGTGLDASASGGGLVASDRFRLDRKAWTSLKAWRVPGVVRDRDRDRTRVDCAPCR